MFAQIITMKVPSGGIDKLRTLITETYLPEVRNRRGFVSAHLLEQVDDRETAHLIVRWATQTDVEEATQTSHLIGSPSSIAAYIPGMRVQRTSFIVTIGAEVALHT